MKFVTFHNFQETRPRVSSSKTVVRRSFHRTQRTLK